MILQTRPKYDIIFPNLLQTPAHENAGILCNRLKKLCKRLRDFLGQIFIFF
jgi:hypothetical protein